MRFLTVLYFAASFGTLPFVHGNPSNTLTKDASNQNAPALQVYDIPKEIPQSHDFSIRVRSTPSGHWKHVQSYQAQVSKVNTTSGSSETHNISVATFDFRNSVEVSIDYTPGTATSFDIRPRSYQIASEVSGNTLSFTLEEPRNLMIQVNDDEFQALHLFSNAIETPPAQTAKDVWFFAPGINTGPGAAHIANNTLRVPSNTTVYLSGGAVLTAQVAFQNMSNASLRGHGVLYQSPGGGVLIESSQNILVQDITILNPSGYNVLVGEADNLHIAGIRGFSAKGNGDGIDLFCTRNAVIEGVFMRNSDDNIALYQHRWGYFGDSANLTVRRSVLFADVAHPVNIGTHGNSESPERMSGVRVEDVDVLHHKETQVWYQGAIAVNAGDGNLIEDVVVKGVRVEEIVDGQLVNLRVMYNSKYNTSPGRGIKDVWIEGLTYDGPKANPSLVLGYNETRGISNVTFVGLEVDGKAIYDEMEKPAWYYTADFVPMFANEFVSGLQFLR